MDDFDGGVDDIDLANDTDDETGDEGTSVDVASTDLYDREGIESADDTGLIAGEELITNAELLKGLSGRG